MGSLFKVRALYEFVGEPNTAELSIVAGETLQVTRVDIGEGWWEGVNSRGLSGLFPEAYVERLAAAATTSISKHDFSSPVQEAPPPDVPPPNSLPPLLPPTSHQQPDDDWDDDEWDNDNDDTYSEINAATTTAATSTSNNLNNNNRESYYSNDVGAAAITTMGMARNYSDNISESNFSVMGGDSSRGAAPATKKSINRFSAYVKSGLESYILGALKDIPNHTKIHIYKQQHTNNNDNEFSWQPLSHPYTVQVTSPKKATKMGGLKTFIAYQLTPSFTGIEVSRRYKHFDWLHDRLIEKFNIIAIPPLPDKQVSGRYEEHFVEHRRVQLQEFVNYMCRHPVLSTCDVWHHFLTCTGEKEWKQGKRNAERDQLVGANFCLCVDAPDRDLLASTVDVKMDLSVSYVNQMDLSIKGLMQTASEQQKKSSAIYKREYSRVGESFFALGAAFEVVDGGMFSNFSADIKKLGTTYVAIGKLFEDQAKIDWQPFGDKLYLYKGITSSYSDIFQIQRNAEQKKKECERNTNTGQQLQHIQINDVRKRTDVLTYSVFAELNHFQCEMHSEFKYALKGFLSEQVNFYKNIVCKLEDTLKRFE